jgi:hypothetical protein
MFADFLFSQSSVYMFIHDVLFRCHGTFEMANHAQPLYFSCKLATMQNSIYTVPKWWMPVHHQFIVLSPNTNKLSNINNVEIVADEHSYGKHRSSQKVGSSRKHTVVQNQLFL